MGMTSPLVLNLIENPGVLDSMRYRSFSQTSLCRLEGFLGQRSIDTRRQHAWVPSSNNRISSSSSRSAVHVQAYESQQPDPSPIRPPPLGTMPLDAEATSSTLGYTWLTHWNLVEEDRQFRKHVFQSTRGRQVQRHRQLLDLFADTDIPPTSSSLSSLDEEVIAGTPRRRQSVSEDEDEAEMRIVNGRFSVVAPHSSSPEGGTTSNNKINDDAVAELAWLATHPDAAAAAQDLGIVDSAASSNSTNPRAWPLNAPPEAEPLPGAVQLRVGAEIASVRPLWVSVHQEESTGEARLYESVVPLQPEIVEKISIDLVPFCSVSGMSFTTQADLRFGPWANYFVGLVGDVAAEEADILWPNQVLHRDRVLYNMRDAGDVARFLADPRKEDVDGHLENLQRLAVERGYKQGWCWYMLKSRWGESVLREMKITPDKV